MAKRLDTTEGRDADLKEGPFIPTKTYKWPKWPSGWSILPLMGGTGTALPSELGAQGPSLWAQRLPGTQRFLTWSLPAQADRTLEEGTLRAVPLLTACHRRLSSTVHCLPVCYLSSIHLNSAVSSVCLETSPVPTSGLHFLLLHRRTCSQG